MVMVQGKVTPLSGPLVTKLSRSPRFHPIEFIPQCLADHMHKEALMKYADQLGQQYLLLVEMAKQVADKQESATA